MNRQKIITLGCVIGGIFLVLGFFYYTYWRYTETTDNAYVQADISIISAKITGYVEEITVQENQKVEKGQSLLKLKDVDFQANFQKAEADVLLAQASLTNIDEKLKLQASLILEQQANVEVSQIECDRAKKEYERTLSLSRHDFLSKKQLDTSQSSYLKALANLKNASAALTAAQQQIPVLKTEQKQNDAKLAQAQAQRIVVMEDVNNTLIKAPIAGIVGNKAIQLGQLVRTGQQLMAIVPENFYIYANFKETQLQNMRVGQPVEIKLDAYPQENFKGFIESISPASGAVFSLLPPENATGNFTKIVQRVPVKVRLNSPPSSLKIVPGMSAVIKVNTKDKTS